VADQPATAIVMLPGTKNLAWKLATSSASRSSKLSVVGHNAVLERSKLLPPGCSFNDDVVANFDEDASISQWSRGFLIGHDWLAEVWDEYLPGEMDEECGATMMVLSFFRTVNQQLAVTRERLTSRTSANSTCVRLPWITVGDPRLGTKVGTENAGKSVGPLAFSGAL